MSETLSVSQRTIERDLSALQKLDILKREGKDNDGVWVILRGNNISEKNNNIKHGSLLNSHK